MADIKQPIDTLAHVIGRDMHAVMVDISAVKTRLDLLITGRNTSGNPQAPWPPPQPAWLDTTGILHIGVQQSQTGKRDIALIPRADGVMDLALAADGDLLADNGLHTAVITSLFSDARDQRERGWWADLLAGRVTGSRLWRLHREKQTTDTLRRAEQYAAESMQWLMEPPQRLATNVAVAASWSGRVRGYMHLQIQIALRK